MRLKREGESEMNTKTEATLIFLAAIFVLISAMLAPWVSAALAVVFLIGFAIYKYTRKA